jgi:hypothetical protein
VLNQKRFYDVIMRRVTAARLKDRYFCSLETDVGVYMLYVYSSDFRIQTSTIIFENYIYKLTPFSTSDCLTLLVIVSGNLRALLTTVYNLFIASVTNCYADPVIVVFELENLSAKIKRRIHSRANKMQGVTRNKHRKTTKLSKGRSV